MKESKLRSFTMAPFNRCAVCSLMSASSTTLGTLTQFWLMIVKYGMASSTLLMAAMLSSVNCFAVSTWGCVF